MTSRTIRIMAGRVLAMMKREDYKAVKHMNKDQMEYYLQHIYQRGYEDGVNAMAKQMKAQEETAAAADGMEG